MKIQNKTCLRAHTIERISRLTMNGVVVAVDAVLLAVIKGILKFADDIHEDAHVGGTLLGGLLTSNESELGEVGVAIVEVGARSVHGRKDPLVGVVERAVVVVVIFVINIRATRAVAVHLLHSTGGEAGNGTLVVVIDEGIVAVGVFSTINLEVTAGSEAADGVFEIGLGLGKSTNLALNVLILVIGGVVLSADLGVTATVVIKSLGGDGLAFVVLAMDLGTLADGSSKRSLKNDLGIGLGVATVLVDLLGNIERLLGTEGELRLHSSLIKVNSGLRGLKIHTKRRKCQLMSAIDVR